MVSASTFRFLDLPSEIRNAVYSLVLTSDDAVRVWFSGSNAWACRHSISAKLLLVNRQIQVEGTPVAYGGNKFTFICTVSLRQFLLALGTSKMHLRRISVITLHNKSALRSSLHILKPITNLTRLEIYPGFKFGRTPRDMAKLLLPWYRSQIKASRLGHSSKEPHEILQVVYERRDGGEALHHEVLALLQEAVA